MFDIVANYELFLKAKMMTVKRLSIRSPLNLKSLTLY